MSNAVEKGFCVVFDSEKENCFYVIDKKKDTVIRFPIKKGLYTRDNLQDPAVCYYTSVEGFTQREVERAKVERKFYHDLNAENAENVKFLFEVIRPVMFQYPRKT